METIITNKTACIITAFYNYDFPIRIKHLSSFLQNRGYRIKIITSDFNHRNKTYYKIDDRNVMQVHVPNYTSNLSIRRVLSHKIFSEKAYEVCCRYNPSLVYVITPPNYLFKLFSKLKKENNVYVVYEIEDLWPETLPFSPLLKKILFPVLRVWKKIRDDFLYLDDNIVSECNLFKEYLLKIKRHKNIKTIYLTKECGKIKCDYSVKKEKKHIDFIYIGSVNHLIDIEVIINCLQEVSNYKKIIFHIIGMGENMKYLLKQCKLYGINVNNHGEIYNEKEKENILRNMDFAFNIMKKSVTVGVTMKSIDYFYYGIPIINNIGGDTQKIIDDYGCGINLLSNDYISQCKQIADLDEVSLSRMKRQSRCVYEEKFSYMCYEKDMTIFFKMIGLE